LRLCTPTSTVPSKMTALTKSTEGIASGLACVVADLISLAEFRRTSSVVMDGLTAFRA
jgi:hypothetical protein